MGVPTLSDLYTFCETISKEGSSPDQKEAAFRAFLLGTKGGEKEKRLACQFIVRFSKQFENLKEESFSCILDLCDDDDVNIRKQAIHDLLQFCKRLTSFVPRVADVLVQMLQTDDSAELHLVSLSLSQLMRMDPKNTLIGIFNQLLTANTESPRDHIMRFLADRLKSVPEDLLTTELEDFVVEQINKVLQDVSEEEFQLLISILSSLKCMSTVPGRQKLVRMITEQALQAVPEFNPTDPACVAQIRESCKQAALCVSKNVHANDLYVYLLRQVMPNILDIPADAGADRLSLLRVTCELSTHHQTQLTSTPKEDLKMFLTSVFTVLLSFLPAIPKQKVGAADDTADKPIIGVSTESTAVAGIEELRSQENLSFHTDLKFSELECLLYIACQLGRCMPQFFGGRSTENQQNEPQNNAVDDDEGLARLRATRPRLQCLSQVAQEYAQSIASQLEQNGQTDEGKVKLIAHRLVTNIQRLVRCFFHNPPLFKTNIPLSWLPSPTNVAAISPGSKRFSETSVDHLLSPASPNPPKRDMLRYTPPVGRWSRSKQPNWNFDSGRGRRGGGRVRY